MGTTTATNFYSYKDKFPKAGVNEYRLKQVDFVGTFDYSPIVKVEIKEGAHEQSVELIASMLSVEYVVKVKLNGEGTDNGFFNIVDVSGLILE